ncbi:MAG: aminotransferase class IV [Bacteroidales bacterium]|nr:aminotransferase class IV [Bacteroidales bacterium]
MLYALCYINNRFLPFNEAKLHISDLGLQRGYGIFDYFLEMDGKVPFLEDYLDRFYRSGVLTGLDVPLEREMLKEKILWLLGQNGFRNSGIKLVLTGGYSEDLYTPPSDPNFMILNLPVTHPPGEFGEGVKLILLDYVRYMPEVKTTFYFPSIALFPRMKAAGAIEVLYHHSGLISETTRANIFLVKEGRLVTPSPGVLRGITRMHVLNVAKQLLPVEEREVRLEELWECDEVFITGTSKHLIPVVEIEGRQIGDGKPGEWTKVISGKFEDFYMQVISETPAGFSG